MGEMRKPQIPNSTEISYKKRHAQLAVSVRVKKLRIGYDPHEIGRCINS